MLSVRARRAAPPAILMHGGIEPLVEVLEEKDADEIHQDESSVSGTSGRR